MFLASYSQRGGMPLNMTLPDPKTQMLETIKLIEKHNLPFEPTFMWCVLESFANGLFLATAATINDEEKLCNFIKEWSALSGLPITDEQLETYKQRLKEAQERFKTRIKRDCPKSPDGIHVVDLKKDPSGHCIHCGEAVC